MRDAKTNAEAAEERQDARDPREVFDATEDGLAGGGDHDARLTAGAFIVLAGMCATMWPCGCFRT